MTDRTAPADPREALLAVAEAAEYLVGSIELGERRGETLAAASKVNEALAALHFPVNDEGLIDWPLAARQDEPSPALREVAEAARTYMGSVTVIAPDPGTEGAADAALRLRDAIDRWEALAANPPQTREDETVESFIAHLDEVAPIGGRQDEPSPALRDVLNAMEGFARARAMAGEHDDKAIAAVVRVWIERLRAFAANPPQTREAEGAACNCDWPGCQGQCHTGDSCPCHPQTREAQRDAEPPDADDDDDLTPEREAAMWAYQYAGSLVTVYDFAEDDIVPLLDHLSAMVEGRSTGNEGTSAVPGSVKRRAPRTPEVQRDAEPPVSESIRNDPETFETAAQRDAGNRGIDLAAFLHERICDPRAAHDETLGRCFALAAEYRATQPPAAGTEGAETARRGRIKE